MSTATTTTAENAGLPAMLDTKDVAEMFKRCNLAVYAEARRIYYREVNLNPCKKYPKQVLQRIEWWFWDWFAYDCAVSGIGLTGNESEDLRIELQYGPGAGISPFLALAEFMYDKDERIGTREIRDFRELDDTNFASMFWIRDASAVKGRLTVEDIIHGGVYEVADVHAASQYDGAHGGIGVRAQGQAEVAAVGGDAGRNAGLDRGHLHTPEGFSAECRGRRAKSAQDGV